MHLAFQQHEQLETVNKPNKTQLYNKNNNNNNNNNNKLKKTCKWQSAAIYKRGPFEFGMAEKQIQL